MHFEIGIVDHLRFWVNKTEAGFIQIMGTRQPFSRH